MWQPGFHPNIHGLIGRESQILTHSGLFTFEIKMPVVSRPSHIADQILFVDGLSGTGKTMMGPIMSCFNRVEIQRIEHIYEYSCILRFLQRIEKDAAVELIQMYIDLACYNTMIGRESNFRWKDVSGVLSNPHGKRYLMRLFQPDGDAVLERIERTRPVLQIISHHILGVAETLFSALGDRLTMLEMVRNPIYLVQHWYSTVSRYDNNPRIFTIMLDHNGQHVPWFAYGWEDKYLASNNMDRAIYIIDWFTRMTDDALDRLEEKRRSQVLVIPFERFVVDPSPYLKQLEQLLGTTPRRSMQKTLKREKIPRKLTTDGRDLEIYRRYSWHPPSEDSTEENELQQRWKFAAERATPEAMEVLARMGAAYEEKYLTPLTADSAASDS